MTTGVIPPAESTPTPLTPDLDWRAWLVAVLFGAVAFALFTRHNDFPFYYHTDEPGKVKQVQTGERNFHHPLLLLRSTEAVLALSRVERTPQAIVEAGRMVSAFYAALAVTALTLLAWSLGGKWAGVIAGALLTTHPVLFELAHYMKEDCTLLGGIAASFLGMSLYAQRPTLARAAGVGVAAGLAASGKAVGLAIAAIALLAVAAIPRNGRRWDWRPIAIYLGAALLVFAAINFEALREIAGAQGGLASEMHRLDKRNAAREGAVEIKYLSKFGRVISVPLILATGYWIWRRWQTRREQSPLTWVLIGFPLVFAATLSIAPVTKERYMLPVFALFCVLGALGIAELFVTRPFRRAALVAGLLAVTAIGWHGPILAQYCREFASDDRRDLIAWIQQNVPADATIAHDRRARLEVAQRDGLPRDRFPQKALSARRRMPDLGSLDELRKDGVRWFVVCDMDATNVLRREKREDKSAREERKFYERLFREGKLRWERPVGRILYLHPGLHIYELPAS